MIYAVGLNYKTASVEVREKLSCELTEIQKIGPLLKSVHPLEFILLSTCNRLEIYTNAGKEIEALSLFNSYCDIKGVNIERKHLFIKESKEAISHVFKVASGLDSMVIGEPQIVAQFKEAFDVSKKFSLTGKIINRLAQSALHVSKRVRTETNISKSAVSISYAAVELAKRIFDNLQKKKVLLVGAGEMGELAAKYLKKLGTNLYITNRTYEKALRLGEELDGNVLKFEELESFIHEMDIIIVSTAAKGYVITKELIQKTLKKRKGEAIFLIDISVPRNIEPSVNDLSGAFLYNIDDLKEVVELNLSDRAKEAKKAEIIIMDETDKFEKWLSNLDIESFIIRLNEIAKKDPSPHFKKLIYKASKLIRKDKEYKNLILELFEGLENIKFYDRNL